eukprot:Hpha_TRINITY_DN10084_c0_g1::TRINITY_DN10084_c0_g1_i1::g.84070::m.84070
MGTQFSCPCGQVDDAQFRRWSTQLMSTPRLTRCRDFDLWTPMPSARKAGKKDEVVLVLESCAGRVTRGLGDVEEVYEEDLESCASEEEHVTERVVVTHWFYRARVLGRDSPSPSRGTPRWGGSLRRSMASCRSLDVCSAATEPTESTEPLAVVRFAEKEARVLSDDLLDCPVNCPEGVRAERWDVLDESGLEALRKGNSICTFACTGGSALSEAERGMVGLVLGCVPSAPSPVNASCATELAMNMFIMTKACFAVPRIDFDMLSPSLVASMKYQNKVCGKAMSASTVAGQPDSIVLTRVVVPYVYSDITRYGIREVPKDLLPSLAPLADGARVDRAIVLVDEMDRVGNYARSLQLYHSLGQGRGCVFWSFTVVVRSSLPTVVAKMVDHFGAKIATEVADTAQLFREYWSEQCPDSSNGCSETCESS